MRQRHWRERIRHLHRTKLLPIARRLVDMSRTACRVAVRFVTHLYSSVHPTRLRTLLHSPALKVWRRSRRRTSPDVSPCAYIRHKLHGHLVKRRRKARSRSPFKRFYMAGLTTFLITGLALFYMVQGQLAPDERVGILQLLYKASQMAYKAIVG